MRMTTPVLDRLTGPARARLLRALRSGPDAGVSVRELSRGAGLSLSSLQAELDRLLALGVVKKSTRGHRTVHGLRREEPFVKLLLAALAALELQGLRFDAMPADRGAESALASLCAYLPPDAGLWRRFGDAKFLAGLAVALAGHSGFDRGAYLALAESLRPGSIGPKPYEAWVRAHRPDFARFFSMVDRERRTHARTAH
jgi:hypothetical protein